MRRNFSANPRAVDVNSFMSFCQCRGAGLGGSMLRVGLLVIVRHTHTHACNCAIPCFEYCKVACWRRW